MDHGSRVLLAVDSGLVARIDVGAAASVLDAAATRTRGCRKSCLRELKKIKLAWPELNYTTAKGVLILSPSKPAIAPTTGPQRLVE